MKNVFFASVLLLCSQGSINGGNTWSYFTKPDPVSPIKTEFKTYLATLDLKSITTRSQLEQYVKDTLNNNVREDKTNFPIFITLINQPGIDDDKNIELRKQIFEIVHNVALEFVNEKCKELNLSDQ